MTRGVDVVEIEHLIDFMEQHGLEEFEYERNGLRIRLRKPSAVPQGVFRPPMPAPDIVVASPPTRTNLVTAAAETARDGSGTASSEAVVSEDLYIVKSPIVGTFYAASSPNAEPFVTVGAHVKMGQVLCIIEAMKLMNEIESEVAGEVVRIFVENGQPVEYGEPLFGIHPNRKM